MVRRSCTTNKWNTYTHTSPGGEHHCDSHRLMHASLCSCYACNTPTVCTRASGAACVAFQFVRRCQQNPSQPLNKLESHTCGQQCLLATLNWRATHAVRGQPTSRGSAQNSGAVCTNWPMSVGRRGSLLKTGASVTSPLGLQKPLHSMKQERVSTPASQQ